MKICDPCFVARVKADPSIKPHIQVFKDPMMRFYQLGNCEECGWATAVVNRPDLQLKALAS